MTKDDTGLRGSAQTLRVLVIDDEAPARQRVLDLLAHETGVEVVGTANNGNDAVARIRELDPDLVFLDMQMPGKTGLEVIRTVGADAMPATIFVTAYDQYALNAFDVAAVDYLVKPFDDERFEQSLARARRLVALEEVDRLAERLRSLLGEGGAPPHATASDAATSPGYLERIAVDMRGQVKIVPVRQIDFIEASGPYAELHVGDKKYLVRERMQVLEERLDPARFLRIHRSVIVRLDLVESLIRGAGGEYAVQLKGGVRLKVSRSRWEEVERALSS
ncbi:MAG: LytTR family DNA-binding domain-containing protein [Gemmatimonadota bacterium]